MISRNIVCSLFAAALAVSVTSTPAQAQRNNQNAVGNVIAALVNVQADDVVVIDLTNVLREADIRILNNVLNNALNNNNVEILTDVVDIQNVLNDLEINVDIDDVIVGVNVLGGTFVLLP